MDSEAIRAEKKRIIKQHGKWTAHNIRLADDVYTISRKRFIDEFKQRRILQIVSDITNRPLEELRVLDLACCEGAYSVEFALHGAEVVGIEGREANIVKAQFAKDVLGLDRLTLIEDDVRNLRPKEHGMFDVVLCIGILYHLNVPDVFTFMERVASVCTRLAIIDTHLGITGDVSAKHKSVTYFGDTFREHDPDSSAEERMENPWASLSDPESFWLTRPSLDNLLAKVGFTSVYECHNPSEIYRPADRITLVAIKGTHHQVRSAPNINRVPDDLWPETPAQLRDNPLPTDPAADPGLAAIMHDAVMLPRRVIRYARRKVDDLLDE